MFSKATVTMIQRYMKIFFLVVFSPLDPFCTLIYRQFRVMVLYLRHQSMQP